MDKLISAVQFRERISSQPKLVAHLHSTRARAFSLSLSLTTLSFSSVFFVATDDANEIQLLLKIQNR
jgi:hypothetical protein